MCIFGRDLLYSFSSPVHFTGNSAGMPMGVLIMKNYLQRLPVPAGCVALGLIGLGTLLGSYVPALLPAAGLLSVLLQISVLLRLFLPGAWKAVCSDYVSLSTLAGTSMAMMLTAAQLKKLFAFPGAVFIWAAAVCFHLFILFLFTRKLLRERPGLPSVRGSWLLVFVGIAAGAISAPAFSAARIGVVLLIPAAAGAVILLPCVYLAALMPGNIPSAQKPLFCITAAPVSIWLAGYLSSSAAPGHLAVSILLIVSQILYIPALLCCLRLLRQPFSPACAAFTFPFVITASALKQASALLSLPAPADLLLYAESLIALLLCGYALWLYLRFLFTGESQAA